MKVEIKGFFETLTPTYQTARYQTERSQYGFQKRYRSHK